MIEYVDRWARLLEKEDYARAYQLTDHDPAMRWTPDLLRTVVKSYVEMFVSTKPAELNPAMALQFSVEDQWRRVTDLNRYARHSARHSLVRLTPETVANLPVTHSRPKAVEFHLVTMSKHPQSALGRPFAEPLQARSVFRDGHPAGEMH